nr:AAA family ATPase [Puerhibacterium puerhi]
MLLMIAGRSGSGKSLFAMWLAAMMKSRTLYFSADMSRDDATSRLAACITGDTIEQVQTARDTGEGMEKYLDALAATPFEFSFQSPMTWPSIERHIEAYVELHDAYPDVFVFDNLMDFEDAEAEYSVQMEVMSRLTELARTTGATIIVLHHATDKVHGAPLWVPPSRDQVKNGMSEKPERVLSVALDETSGKYRVAITKNRGGKQDPGAVRPITLWSDPERVRFYRWEPAKEGV